MSGPHELERVEAALSRLAAEFDPQLVFRAMLRFLDKKKWKPGCGKERSYTYEHITQVEACPIPEGAEAKLEGEAQALAEAKVKAFCERNDGGCTDVEIVDSAPTGGGCTCVAAMGVKRCAYVVRWTVTYKCKQAPQ
jgi:hypothetical protein